MFFFVFFYVYIFLNEPMLLNNQKNTHFQRERFGVRMFVVLRGEAGEELPAGTLSRPVRPGAGERQAGAWPWHPPAPFPVHGLSSPFGSTSLAPAG